MPPVIIAIASSWAASAAGAYLVGMGFAATGFVVTAAKFFVAFAISAIGNKVLGSGASKAPPVQGSERLETLRSPIATRKLIYGTVRTGSTLVYGETSGPDHQYLHLVLALAHGQIQGVRPRFWVGDRASDHPDIASRIYLATRNGADNQTAINIPELGSLWTPAHRLAGIAHAYLRMDYSATAFPSGAPACTFLIDGCNTLLDPRTGTTGWSNNAALVILDYLRRSEGLDAGDHLIDYDSFIAAANVCDELVPTYESATPGGEEKRYTINGVISLDAGPASIIDAMESACCGQLVFSGGKYRLYVGAFEYPTTTIDESWLRGDPTIRLAPSRAQQFNTIRGSYVDPLQDWQPADFAEVVNEPQLLADGTEVVQTVNYALTTSGATARRLAKIDLYRNQNASSLQLPLNWSGMTLSLWQTVRVKGFAPLGDRCYRVVEFTLAEGGGVDITLQEETPDLYEWDVATDDVPARSLATLPPLFPYPVVETVRAGLTYDQINGTYAVAVGWAPVRGWTQSIADYTVEVRFEDGTWQGVGNPTGNTYTFAVPDDALYVVRVRANDVVGTDGPFSYAQTGDGATRRLGQLADFAVTAIGDGVEATWTADVNAFGGYEVQARSSDRAEWSPLFQTTNTYVAVDTQGFADIQVSSPDEITAISVRARAIGYAGVRGYWSPVKTAAIAAFA